MFSALDLIDAPDADELAQVVRLLRAYRQWLRRRYKGMNDIVRSLFDPLAWEDELDNLATHYASPNAALLLARGDGVPVGCVAFRPLEGDVCEMKRLFVHPQYQGHGVALRMIERLATIAGHRGYNVVRLETGPRQTEAQALYVRLELKRIDPYYACSPWSRENVLFYEGTPDGIAARAGARLDARGRVAA
ncbi:MAG: GNAT family N-acetyltransferase [Alphaproteobacteria bacterium]|nr:GNAT family N-acetyltransferase [Alphaproteobacteria bacterium]